MMTMAMATTTTMMVAVCGGRDGGCGRGEETKSPAAVMKQNSDATARRVNTMGRYTELLAGPLIKMSTSKFHLRTNVLNVMMTKML